MMQERIRNSTHLSQKDKDWNLSCFRIVAFLASGQALVYLATSLINRHVLPNLLNAWNELECNALSLHQEVSLESQPCTKTWTSRRCIAAIALAILISLCPAALICSSVQDHPDYWLEVSFNFVAWTHMGLMETLHDLVLIMFFKELRGNFAWVSPIFSSGYLPKM